MHFKDYNNQWEIFSSLIGYDLYAQGVAMAIKMYVYELNGIPFDIVTIHDKQSDINN